MLVVLLYSTSGLSSKTTSSGGGSTRTQHVFSHCEFLSISVFLIHRAELVIRILFASLSASPAFSLFNSLCVLSQLTFTSGILPPFFSSIVILLTTDHLIARMRDSFDGSHESSLMLFTG